MLSHSQEFFAMYAYTRRLGLFWCLFALGALMLLLVLQPARADGPAFLVKDITPGANIDGPNTPLIEFNGILFFMYQSSIWRSDGTEAGTFQLSDQGSFSLP